MKSAAFIFDFLTNKLTISITLETVNNPNGQPSLAGIVLDQTLTVTKQKSIGL